MIGFMGSGKSAIGQELAKELCLTYLDTDQLIEEKEGKSINDIFARQGEEYFRGLETAALRRLLVLLWAGPETIYERVKNETQRPLLKVADPLAEIKKILEQRSQLYNRVADYKVDTSKLSINECVKGIEQWLKSKLN